jgi:perosamine synthetase
VPALTMIATANAVRLAGALPVLVDVDARTLCTGVEQLADSISERTRAVISVSFNGRSPDLPKLAAWCAAHNLTLIEDAAQSFGSRAFGRHLGTFGRAGCFSFSPHKIITTGQGGAVATDDEQLAERMHAVKDFGRRQPGTDVHEIIGYNFKFTDLQAVVGLAQLATLGARLARKRAMFTRFRDGLADIDEVRFVDTDLLETTPWFMDVLTENRTGLRAYLATDGIETRAFYPPVHLQPAYANDPAVLGKGRRFPVSEDVSRRGLWLPSSLKLTDEAIDRICRSIRGFYQGRG